MDNEMNKRPSLQFYPADWLKDPDLQMCSMGTIGIWINLLCRMWEAKEEGILRGKPDELALLIGAKPREFKKFLEEAERHYFCDVLRDVTKSYSVVTVKCRRMNKLFLEREGAKKRMQRHRGKQCDAVVTPYTSSSSSSSKKDKQKYGEFVLLTKGQYQELIKKLTKPVVDQLIVDLNLGIGTHGYKYKSHYHVIQTWHRKNLKSKGGSAVPQEKLATPVCIVCKATGRWYKKDRQGKPVYLCPTCAKALATVGIMNWGHLKKSAIEKGVERGKAMLATRSTPAEPTHEASVNDKRNAAAKLIAENTKNFGKV